MSQNIFNTSLINLLKTMFKFAKAVLLGLFLGLYALAHDNSGIVKYSSVEMYEPTPMPDRIVLTWEDNPATTQSITWRTDTSVKKAFVQIAVANASGRDLNPDLFEAKTLFFQSDINQAHYHSITIRSLNPNTLYVYRVGDGVNWSEYFHFKTASSYPEPFSFIYFGDAQNEVRTHWSRVFREAFRDAPRASFILHAGDLVDIKDMDSNWGEWHEGPDWVNATIPLLATPGNHEYVKYSEAKRTAPEISAHWQPQFVFPIQNIPDERLKETVYYLDYQGVRFISLDSNIAQEEQVPWIRSVLEKNPNKWTVVTFHHPIYSPGTDRDNPNLRKLWKPLFDEFKVDLVLNGHDHVYSRTGDLAGAKVENVPNGYQQAYDPDVGTVYVVSVSGPKMYEFTKGNYAKKILEDTQLYQIIKISGNDLRFQAFDATGNLYDEFKLKKHKNKPNQLIELSKSVRNIN